MIDLVVIYGGGGLLGAVLGGGAGVAGGVAFGASTVAHGKDLGPGVTAAILGFFGGFVGAWLGAAIGVGLIATAFLILEGLTGRSPGKLLCGLKVGADDGSAAGLDVLLLRAGIKHIAGAIALASAIPGMQPAAAVAPMAQCLVTLGMLLALGANRQALHDTVAGTAVYRVV